MRVTNADRCAMPRELADSLVQYLYDVGLFYRDPEDDWWRPEYVDIGEGELTSFAINQRTGEGKSFTVATREQPPRAVLEWLVNRAQDTEGNNQ